MIVTFGDWRIAPYLGGGMRCWQVQHGKSRKAIRYYDRLGDALLFCAEYDLRNKVEGATDLSGALAEYSRIAERIERAAEEAVG